MKVSKNPSDKEQKPEMFTAGNYSDIIDLPRPESHHPKADTESRAGQFAPFAALVGYEELVQDTTERTLAEVENEVTVRIDEFVEDLEISQDTEETDTFSDFYDYDDTDAVWDF